MKTFTDSDVQDHGVIAGAGSIYTKEYRKDLILDQLDWQKRGLQQSATGYGAKLTTGYKINFNGKLFRVYCTCYGNAGSCWFISRGRKIFVS